MLYAPVPTGYTALETIQIRPAAGTYASTVNLIKGNSYFLQLTGKTVTQANVYAGDGAFATGSTASATTWGVSVIDGATTGTAADWGAFQSDHIYGQIITPTANATPSFVFANTGTDAASTLAVTIYGPVPSIQVASIRTNKASGFVTSASLKSAGIYLPLNDADFDHNGTADNAQSGRVKGDQFLLPITLPAISGASLHQHYTITVPAGLRVWFNPDRTGKASGVGIRANKSHVVYLEGRAEQVKQQAVTMKVSIPFGGKFVEQQVPVTVFKLSGPATVAGGSTQTYACDSPNGNWSTAVGGTLDSAGITHVKPIAYARVTWKHVSSTTISYADFKVNKDYLWGLPVDVTTG